MNFSRITSWCRALGRCFALGVILLFLIPIASCNSDDSSEPAPEPAPQLNGISPSSGPKTTVVTISGSNFGTDIGAVKVFFNETEANVQSVNETEIKAFVPARAFSGLVKVEIDGISLTGPEFTYIITEVVVSTLAGSTEGFMEGSGSNAQFNSPLGVAVDADGNVYVADWRNYRIRKITPNGVVSTLAGSTQGSMDGSGSDAQFHSPWSVAVDMNGLVYVVDSEIHKIRKITPEGVVTTLAGSTAGFMDGNGEDAQFNLPRGLATDKDGNIYVADQGNHKIRKITPEGVVSTLAGSTQGFMDGLGTNAQFEFPIGVAVDTAGNVYVTDSGNDKIRKITPAGVVRTFAGSTAGFMEGAALEAKFDSPRGLTVDAEGNVYVADRSNHRIRKISPDGTVSTLAGSLEGFMDGMGADALFDFPLDVSIDIEANLYVADGANHRVRKITQE